MIKIEVKFSPKKDDVITRLFGKIFFLLKTPYIKMNSYKLFEVLKK